MCEFSAKLIAWMDGELPLDEAGCVEEHLESCVECPARLAAYRQVAAGFEAYCDAAMTSSRPRRGHAWFRAAGAAIAAGIMLVLLVPRPRPDKLILPSLPTAQPPAIALRPTPIRVPATQRARQAKLAAKRPAQQLGEPEMQIVLPADAIFPPGALPDGFEFVANVSIEPDGSLAVGLRP